MGVTDGRLYSILYRNTVVPASTEMGCDNESNPGVDSHTSFIQCTLCTDREYHGRYQPK